jgi:molybdate transport system substrate-binding protein
MRKQMRMSKPTRQLAILPLALLFAFPAAAQITAAVAANVRYAMEELVADFAKPAGAEVKTVYGASGQLAAQIRNGAPFDVFVSADMEYPDSLARRGYAAAPPRPYAFGKLVFWTMKDLDLAKGLALLAEPGVATIAIADPQRAPYGREAFKAIRGMAGFDHVKGKLVYGGSIAQVNEYVLLGTVDVGITAESVVLAGEMRGKGKWAEVDGRAYAPIAQGAVACGYGMRHHPALAARFLDYLYSAPARAILSRYGYVLP